MNRILVVDDEKSITFALRQYFSRQGYTVDCAQDSAVALELLAANEYSVAIVDVELRESGDASGGFHLARFIRSHAPATAVIMLTGVETVTAQQQAVEAGVHCYLCKPARLSHVAAVAFHLMRGTNVSSAALPNS